MCTWRFILILLDYSKTGKNNGNLSLVWDFPFKICGINDMNPAEKVLYTSWFIPVAKSHLHSWWYQMDLKLFNFIIDFVPTINF